MLYINTSFTVMGDSLEELTNRAVSQVRDFYSLESENKDEIFKKFNVELDIYSTPHSAPHDSLYECTVYAKRA